MPTSVIIALAIVSVIAVFFYFRHRRDTSTYAHLERPKIQIAAGKQSSILVAAPVDKPKMRRRSTETSADRLAHYLEHHPPMEVLGRLSRRFGLTGNWSRKERRKRKSAGKRALRDAIDRGDHEKTTRLHAIGIR
jgi:hypothetical protein